MRTASSQRKRFSAPSSTFCLGPGDFGVACSANRSAGASSRPFPSVPRTSPPSPPAALRGTTTATRGTASPPWHREGPWPTSSGPRCRRRRRRSLLGFGAPISSQPCLLLLLTTSQRGKQRSQARRCESACRIESHDAGRLNSAHRALTACTESAMLPSPHVSPHRDLDEIIREANWNKPHTATRTQLAAKLQNNGTR